MEGEEDEYANENDTEGDSEFENMLLEEREYLLQRLHTPFELVKAIIKTGKKEKDENELKIVGVDNDDTKVVAEWDDEEGEEQGTGNEEDDDDCSKQMIEKEGEVGSLIAERRKDGEEGKHENSDSDDSDSSDKKQVGKEGRNRDGNKDEDGDNNEVVIGRKLKKKTGLRTDRLVRRGIEKRCRG